MPLPLAYRVYGHTGPSVLILHGLFGQADNWTRIAKTISEQGFTVYTIDLRNHGLSPHSETWTYEDMADDVRFFIEQHGLTKPFALDTVWAVKFYIIWNICLQALFLHTLL